MDTNNHSTGINCNSSYFLLVKFGSYLYFTYENHNYTSMLTKVNEKLSRQYFFKCILGFCAQCS